MLMMMTAIRALGLREMTRMRKKMRTKMRKKKSKLEKYQVYCQVVMVVNALKQQQYQRQRPQQGEAERWTQKP